MGSFPCLLDQNIVTHIYFPILQLGELQTTYKCFKPKIDPPYCTVYSLQCTVCTQDTSTSTHTPRTGTKSFRATGHSNHAVTRGVWRFASPRL